MPKPLKSPPQSFLSPSIMTIFLWEEHVQNSTPMLMQTPDVLPRYNLIETTPCHSKAL